MFLRMVTGEQQNEILCENIRCPKFKAEMKAMSFRCLLEVFSAWKMYSMFVNY